MTRDDCKKLVAVMSGVYPNYSPKNLSLTLDVLTKVYENCEYSRIEKALAEYIASDTSGFAPAPGQLIALATKDTAPAEVGMTAQEAWDLVLNALRNSAYNSISEFKKLPELVQRCVGSADRLRQMAIDEDFKPQIEFSIFSRTFEQLREKKRVETTTLMVEGENDDTRRLADLVKNTAMALPGRLPDR